MDDEIDLRPYILALVRGWYWILGSTVVVALLVFGYYKYIKEPEYKASALVIPLPPLYNFILSPQIRTNESLSQRNYPVLPDLAKTDQVMGLVFQEVTSKPEYANSKLTIQKIRGMTRVESDGTTITSLLLEVTNRDPVLAADVANIWADVFMREVNRIYGEGQEEITFLETELTTANEQRSLVEQAMIDFTINDTTAIMDAKYKALQASYQEIVTEKANLVRLAQDIASLRNQLNQQPASQAISLGDELSIISLQLRLYNAQSESNQLQFSVIPEYSGRTAGEAIIFLESLSIVAQDKSQLLLDQMSALETELLEIQQSIETTSTQKGRLADERTLAINLTNILSTKLAESRIIAQENYTSYVTVGSYAAIPNSPVSPGRMILLLGGAGIGFFLSSVTLLVIEYARSWKRDEMQEEPEKISSSINT